MGETTSRGTYARERLNLTEAILRRARGMIASGRLEGRGTEFLDTACQGLTLRVTPASGTWYLRMRARTVKLGGMEDLNVPAAREAATRARLDVASGANPAGDLAMFRRMLAKTSDVQHAAAVAFPAYEELQSQAERRRRGPWQWGDLVDLFLADKAKTLKDGYGSKYGAYLRGVEFEPIEDTPLASLDIADLTALRDRVAESRTVSAAARTVAQGKEALSWAWTYHPARSGLEDVQHPWWKERWAIAYQPGIREHTPTTTELVRTLLVAERHLALGSTTQQTGPGMLSALWAVVLTAQRTGALATTRRNAIKPWDGHPGWQVWTWTGRQMKGGKNGGRPHAIPIPPAAVAAIARCGAPTDSEWLFPSRAAGRSISPTGINQCFYRLMGRPKPGKGTAVTVRPEGNLLKAAAVRDWTPHDARRSLSTYLSDEDLGGSGSAILAHSTGRGEKEHERVEDITRRVYDKAQRLELKSRGMAAWVEHVLATYERERAAMSRAS